MPVKQNNNRRQAKKEALFNSFLALQNDPLCSVNEIAHWIEEHAQQAHVLLTNRKCHAISSVRASWELNANNDKPCFRVDLSGKFDDLENKLPDLHCLNGFLPGMYFFGFSQHSNFIWSAQLEIDLDLWPHLVHVLLNDCLYYALVMDIYDDAAKREALNEAEYLLKQYQPGVSMDLMYTAVTLGLVEANPKSFVDWFAQHVSTHACIPVSLPQDFS